MQKNVHLDGTTITDWDSFHDQFSAVLGFPAFYGRNMDAWNDCMTYLDDPAANLASVHVPPGEVLVLSISGASAFKKKCPEIYDALLECAAFVNYRRIEAGDGALLALSFHT